MSACQAILPYSPVSTSGKVSSINKIALKEGLSNCQSGYRGRKDLIRARGVGLLVNILPAWKGAVGESFYIMHVTCSLARCSSNAG